MILVYFTRQALATVNRAACVTLTMYCLTAINRLVKRKVLTMAEYIKRETVLERAEYDNNYRLIIPVEAIKATPAADVAPVVHGRWKLLRKGDWTSVFVCSVCGRRETIEESESYNSQLKMPREYPYCHCGARMDGGNENDR